MGGSGFTLPATPPATTLLNFDGGNTDLPTLLPSQTPVGEIDGTIGGPGATEFYKFD
jgi:hypothetical protein